MGLFNKTKKNEVQRTTAQSDNPYRELRQQALK